MLTNDNSHEIAKLHKILKRTHEISAHQYRGNYTLLLVKPRSLINPHKKKLERKWKSRGRSATCSDPERRSEDESNGGGEKTGGEGRRDDGGGRGGARCRRIGGVSGGDDGEKDRHCGHDYRLDQTFLASDLESFAIKHS